MFSSVGWGEIVVLALAALFIFGPERLPGVAKDAAEGVKWVREAVTGVRGQLHDTLGDDLDRIRHLDVRQYHPRTLLRHHLIGGDDDPPSSRDAGGTPRTEDVATAGHARQTVGSRARTMPPPSADDG